MGRPKQDTLGLALRRTHAALHASIAAGAASRQMFYDEKPEGVPAPAVTLRVSDLQALLAGFSRR
jgi:hypothetical protein